ncbi:hypothetical protein TRFO_07241 [Tritrichomonas foetus]|uniref:Uncharacterized protein n=1 Tax=Tritrichomonas foetus TaxID=1144522 RepID=A0A1J4JXS7_9EUKA|nr:hypothetical protein TRFO_07241 [Tritrichomonas foetus]|eukprot:OHT02069.1 hypothetical protein TRFO_07241 [Tritrichomonas foetus]
MEEVFYFTNDGLCRASYRLDGGRPKTNPEHLWAASTQFLSLCKSTHSIQAANGKIIAFYPLEEESILIYISSNQYCPMALYKFLRSQSVMILSFSSNFIRPIHMNGMHIHNLLGAPRVYPRQYDKATYQLIQDLIVATSSPICALYAHNMIIIASDEFWKMTKRDIHAIDLLVRHCEAPFTDQIIARENGKHERALIFHVFKSMKFVTINGKAFDALQAAAQLLPEVLYKQADLLKTLEKTEPIVNNQDGVVAWIVHDLATHRFFGECPEELEHQFIEMICKCYDITDGMHRIKDISMRLADHMFFYMPQILVKNTSYFAQPHFWTFFAMHDLHKSVEEIRKFSSQTLIHILPYVKPVNSVEPFLQDVLNSIN